jgi:glyoxalase family protein
MWCSSLNSPPAIGAHPPGYAPPVRLEGIHHVTAITANAPANVDFYVRVLGLRLVKKTVNFDQPDVYHLYYGDDSGSPGSLLTFFEFPGAAPGRHGAGMVHTLVWRVRDQAALEFWRQRLQAEGVAVSGGERRLRLADPEGLGIELAVSEGPDPSLIASHPQIPEEMALAGLDAVRAYAAEPPASAALLEQGLNFTVDQDGAHTVAGAERHARYVYEPAPREGGRQGAGSVHHVAWSALDDAELDAWRQRVTAHGARPTPIIDRTYFHSVYFREPSGVLFELATRGPGFAVDEDPDRLGQSLALPARYEAMREQLERTLTPLPQTPPAS